MVADKREADDADRLEDSRLNDCQSYFRVALELHG